MILMKKSEVKDHLFSILTDNKVKKGKNSGAVDLSSQSLWVCIRSSQLDSSLSLILLLSHAPLCLLRFCGAFGCCCCCCCFRQCAVLLWNVRNAGKIKERRGHNQLTRNTQTLGYELIELIELIDWLLRDEWSGWITRMYSFGWICYRNRGTRWKKKEEGWWMRR